MLCAEDGDLKFLRERKTSLASEKETRRNFSPAKTYLDQPGHFTTPLLGENQLGKPEAHHNLESVLFEDKVNEVTLTCYCRWNVITQKDENNLNKVNKCR